MSSSTNFDDAVTRGLKIKKVLEGKLPDALHYGKVIDPLMLSDHEEYYNQKASEELGVRRLKDTGNTKLS